MPKQYWTYAFTTATYLINRLPTPVLTMESPYQKLFGEAPNYTKLRVFGCLCFPWLRPYTTHKLEDRSTPCVFIGYSQTQSAYLCLQPHSGRVYVSRHVKFDEIVFPFQTSSSSISPPVNPTTPTSSFSTPTVTTIPLPTPPQNPTSPPPLVPSPSPGPAISDPHLSVQPADSSSGTTVRTTENLTTETTASHIAVQPSPPSAHTQQQQNSPQTSSAQSPNIT